jgi:hypothetical protein
MVNHYLKLTHCIIRPLGNPNGDSSLHSPLPLIGRFPTWKQIGKLCEDLGGDLFSGESSAVGDLDEARVLSGPIVDEARGS